MSSKSRNFNKNVRGTVIVVAMVMLLASALLFLRAWENKHGVYADGPADEPAIVYNGAEYVNKENIETFLVLGLDKFDGDVIAESYNNDRQADFLMLFVFDNDAKTCSTIQINRDTITEINVLGVAGNRIDTVDKQIALAHTYGNGRDVSCRNTADAVSKLLLDIRVDHYVSVTMDAVSILNDHIGGVQVQVLDDFKGIDPTLIKGRYVTLKGEHALNYVRSRYGMEESTNINRMKRQQQYLEALYNKALTLYEENPEFALDALLKVADYMVSDRSVTQLQVLADKFMEYEFVEIESIDGESKKGKNYMEFYPNEESIKKIVFDLFYEPKN